jgi:tetratricopeptide (TPR) repeat protein
MGRRSVWAKAAAAIVGGLALTSSTTSSASSADELVKQAHDHEASHDDDVALRRYTDALTIDPTHGDAWLGLGALRMKLGDPGEADRVYSAAIDRVPALVSALQGRARARWVLGRHTEAERDLDAYATLTGDPGALRELAEWFGADGRTPAQLATWRRLLALVRGGDEATEKEARRMVRALVILVDTADPVSSPIDPGATRRALAGIARRGG